ncbi:MAG TPA: AMP-dependent synthetase/ligase [Solirubrobacterales bacterium]|nr:AMP-dependent synthetase/ligase [Solirubrobacterales bacterium]HMU26605.1 AMP-dependent synthetase/ligase [Solirubrobacterales bacterium]HMX70977.1 AMP-dependent synthetase/ligase [Solirubrobacterales bacterium]HMY26412.1 AMP-dependent synthetase/ligase [Solirubrobacterales bacterium]HNA23310.1 AMP-dependent synthetase/ligase [Solirubrobacterales bacterium]
MSSTYTPTNRSRTLADLLPNSAARHGSDGAFLFKNEAGSWEETSYEKVAAEVQALTLGLKALGVQRGDKVAIIGNTRPEWTLFDFAAMSTGATVVPIYQSNSPSECQYVLEHSESRVVIAENEDQLAKIREVRDSLPALENVVIMIGEADDAISMNELRAKGDSGSAEDYKASYEAVEPDDLCKIVYTSGTTGPPKGCMISHGNYRAMLDMADSASIVEEGETSYLFLPLAHVFALLIQYGMIDIGGRIAFWERDQLKIVPNLAEVKPESFPSVPRIFEKVHDTAVATAEGEGGLKAAIFRWAFRVGKRYRKAEAQGKKPGFLLTKQFNFADKAVFSKIREIFGGNLRVAISGAAPIDPEILRFYEAAGVPLFEAWGMTETSTGGTTNMPGENRIGTVGKPVDGVELRIAEDGELLIKGDNVFQGYYKNPEATAETITDGWLHTGDIASIDEDGYVSIIGRKKEIIITAGGKNITPVNIEQEVKRHPLVSQCVVIGDRRPYLIALITLDQEALTRFAAEQGMLDEPGAMVGSPLVRETLEQHIEEVNRNFARVEQIKRFHILPHDLSQEGGELTPTLKIKRPVVATKYEKEIEDLYAS